MSAALPVYAFEPSLSRHPRAYPSRLAEAPYGAHHNVRTSKLCPFHGAVTGTANSGAADPRLFPRYRPGASVAPAACGIRRRRVRTRHAVWPRWRRARQRAEEGEDDEDPCPGRQASPARVPEDEVEERGQGWDSWRSATGKAR